VIAETVLNRGTPKDRFIAYELLKEAMRFFEEAEILRPFSNENAMLRWNTCVRLLEENDLSPKCEGVASV
jgi:hypothetical protein